MLRCPECGGLGYYEITHQIDNECGRCAGMGEISEEEMREFISMLGSVVEQGKKPRIMEERND